MRTMVICAGCDQPIYDRYLLHVLDKAWHSSCVTCCECKILLTDKCFSRENRLYCKDDFFKRYGTKCAGCNQVIAMNDLVRRARDKVFHIDCFCCMSCQKRLDTGEELYIINGCKFLCKEDYLNSRQGTIPNSTCVSECGSDMDNDDDELCDDIFSPSKHDISKSANDDGDQSSPESTPSQQQMKSSQDENNGGSNGSQGGAKRRGPRTTIKAKQLETLKAAFAATPKPTRHIREQLAQETGLNMRVIQVWFQNRRSKERRMKQLRYGSFRPGSRRSRNAMVRGDDPSMVSESSGLFPDGINRGEDPYYHHAMNYYCDIFGAEHPGSSRPELGLPQGAPTFMLTHHHGDDVGSGMDPHQTGEPAYLLDGRPLRPQPSPDGGMSIGPDDVYRNAHGFNGPLSVSNIKPEPGMPTVRW